MPYISQSSDFVLYLEDYSHTFGRWVNVTQHLTSKIKNGQPDIFFTVQWFWRPFVKLMWQLIFNVQIFISYRRLSLSQSPGDQKKYFELSVVWDLWCHSPYMLDHRDYNLHVHVFGNDILQFKYPLTELLISDTNFEKAVSEITDGWWLLTSKNAVKQCSIPKVTKVLLRTLWV